MARILVDLAAARTLAESVPSVDAALREGLTTAAEIRAVADAHPTLVGAGRVHRTLAAADPRAASALESSSRMVMRGSGAIPRPETAVVTRGFDGAVIGLLPFGWRDGTVVGLPDDPDLGGASVEVIDELRALGAEVIVWGWSAVATPARLVSMLRAVLDRRVPDRTPW